MAKGDLERERKKRRPSRRDPDLRAVHPRWHQLSGLDMAQEVCAISDGLESDQKSRTNRYLLLTSLYEMRALDAMHASAYESIGKYYEDVCVPVERSLCDTVQADIAGRQRIKPMFSTTGADWRTRRKAKKLDRFVEAVLHGEQGTYMNGWELCDDVVLDEAICGHGITTVDVDDTMGEARVSIRRRRPGSLRVDAREAENGDPLNFFDSWMEDEDILIAKYVDAEGLMVRDENEDGTKGEWRAITDEERDDRRAKIRDAAMRDVSVTIESYGTTRIARSVKVRRAWRKPISKDQPGLVATCIPNCVLDENDWTRGDPAVIWRWSRERNAYWGTGLVEETKSLAAEHNRAIRTLQERMVLCANKTVWYKEGSVLPEHLEGNESERHIPYTGDAPPQDSIVPPFTPQEMEWPQYIRQLAHESPGVSMMSATSRKEQDVTAGVAIRTLIDLASKRFAMKAKYGYEQPFVQLAKHIVLAVAEYVEATGKDVIVALPRKRGAEELKWSDVKLDIKNLVVQIQPGSTLPTDEAGRKQTLAEGFQQGLYSPATYKRLLAWTDLEAETDRENAEYEYLEMLLERYLDAEEDEPYQYEPPDGYILDKGAAMVQFAQSYFVAKREGAPQFNLDILRRYMLQLGDAIDRATQPDPAAQAGAPPPGTEIGNPTAGLAGAAVAPQIGAAA